MTRLLIITGLPGTGKSTLASSLARHLDVPLLAKDEVKDKLLDWLPAADGARSRQLSNASFAVLFMMAQNMVRTGRDVLLEGNFRSGEHEDDLRAIAAERVAQVLCRVDEATRRQRLRTRAASGGRHPGHGELELPRAASNDAFLGLPGERWLHEAQADDALLQTIDRWWQAAPDRQALRKG